MGSHDLKVRWGDIVIIVVGIILLVIFSPSIYNALFFIAGLIVGRLYGWAKYHYPEFQEKLKLDVARYRLQRARVEADEAEQRARIDRLYDDQISEVKKAIKAAQQ
jgi:hypothetical protein